MPVSNCNKAAQWKTERTMDMLNGNEMGAKDCFHA